MPESNSAVFWQWNIVMQLPFKAPISEILAACLACEATKEMFIDDPIAAWKIWEASR